jgi:hypothetical protein
MSRKQLRAVVSLVAAFILLAWVYLSAAGSVAVSRDGSLVFAQPDNSSAVMDILSRGTLLELLEEGPDWDKVRLGNNGGEGYIRADAVSKTIMPGAFNPDSVRIGSPFYLELQSSMDETETRMRQIAGILDNLDKKLTAIRRADSLQRAMPAGSRPRAGTAAGGMLGYRNDFSLALSAFYGAMLDNTDFAAGLAAAWFPGLPAGLGIEFEAGALFPDFVEESYWGHIGIHFPLGGWERVMPYVAGGGGMLYRKYSIGSLESSVNDPIASVGGGVIVRLAGSVAIKADTRYVWQFAEQETEGDSRVYIGAAFLR